MSESVFCLTLPMHYTHGQKNELDKIFRVCCNIQNSLISDRLKALRQLERTKEWRSNQKAIALLYKDIETLPKGKKTLLDADLKELFEKRQKMLSDLGFSEYSFQERIKKWRYHYDTLCHSAMAQNIASDAWKGFEKYLYGNGKEIHFKPWEKFDKIESKTNTTGLRYENGYLYYGKRFKKRIEIPLDKKDIYEVEALQNNVKRCKIIRGWGKSGAFYQLQLVLEGTPPVKKNKDGTEKYPLGKGRVGNDIGTQTIATVSENNATLRELADKTPDIQKEIRIINRKMDRSRRANNPEFFDHEGKVIPINKLPKELVSSRGKRIWKNSKNYERLAKRRRYLYFKQATVRELQHRTMANEFLTWGDKFFIETMQFQALAKRSKEAKKTKAGKNKSKARFGKSITNKAPAGFVKIYSDKVISKGGTFTKINTFKAKASQYNHLNHEYKKKKLSQRWNDMPDGRKIQRDLYSAFLIMNTARNLESFSKYLCKKHYPAFCVNHDKEIERLKEIKTPSSTGVKKAS